MIRLFQLLRYVATAGFLGASLLGWLGSWFWLFDLFAHFRIHYLCLCVPLVLLCMIPKRSAWTWSMCLGAIALNVFAVAPYVITKAKVEGASDLRVVQINVLTSNRNMEPALKWIVDQEADLVVVQEVNQRWLNALNQSLGASYPHQLAQPMDNNFGMAVFSKHPLAEPEVSLLVHMALPCLFARIDTPDGPVRLFAVHPPPPMSGRSSQQRNATLERLLPRIKHAKEVGEHVLVIGDLNATPWSHAFRNFVKRSGLVDTQRWSGLQPTWKARWGRFGIAIDHVLVSEGFEVLRREIGPRNGSDHLPVVVDLMYK